MRLFKKGIPNPRLDTEKKQRILMELAQKDSFYSVWTRILAEEEQAFEAHVEQQPEPIRSILWGYVGLHRMRDQRVLEIACAHMDFIDSKYKKA